MSVLVLNQEEVEQLLDMAGCIEAMSEALASLAHGEVHVPLRFVVKPKCMFDSSGGIPFGCGDSR